MSTTSFLDFLAGMFPNVDRALLLEMCSNLKSDAEVDNVVVSLLEGGGGGEDHREPQATDGGTYPPTDISQAESQRARVLRAGEMSCLPYNVPHGCLRGESPYLPGHVHHNFVYPAPPRNGVPVYGSHYCPLTGPVAQSYGQFQQRARLPFAYQSPAAQPNLQTFYTSPFEPEVQPMAHCISYYRQDPVQARENGPVQTKENHVEPWVVQGASHQPEPFGENIQACACHFCCNENVFSKPNSGGEEKIAVPSGEVKASDMEVTEDNVGGLGRTDQHESIVVQEPVVCGSESSEMVIASHYLSLVTILPDYDPMFIRKKCEEIDGNVAELQKFVVEALTVNNHEKNSCVSAEDDKQHSSLSTVREEEVPVNSGPADGGEGYSTALSDADEPSLPSESCVAEMSRSGNENLPSEVDEEVAAVPSALLHDRQTESEDSDGRTETIVSDAGSGYLGNFEIVKCTDVISGAGDKVPCAVSSELEFELNMVKLETSENESGQQLVFDVEELGTSTSSSEILETTVESDGSPTKNSSGNLDSPSDESICSVEEVASGSSRSHVNPAVGNSTEAAGSSDVLSVHSMEDNSESDESCSVIVIPDVDSGDIVSNDTFELSYCTGVDVEASQLPAEPSPCADVSRANGDSPPELFEADPDSSTTVDDYEIARLMSEQDEACGGYVDPLEEKISLLLNFMPDADPSYLKDVCERFSKDEAGLLALVQESLDSNDYPNFDDYLERQEAFSLVRESLSQITIPMFVNLYTSPFVYFYGSRRKEQSEVAHELAFLQRRYRNITDGDLRATLDKCDHNLTLACKELDSWEGPTQHMRGDWECQTVPDIDMSFIHEVFFIENEREIREYLELESFRKTVLDRAKFMEAKLECQICYEDDLEIEQMAACAEGHLFCKNCVKKSAETRIGDGLTKFPCLEDSCNTEFSTRTLESLLNPTLFTRMVQQRSLEEVESAHIEDLVRCPFCEYAAILPPNLSVFICENTDCMKETCRYCKEPNHIPLCCNEVEKEGETKMRTEIEDRMSDALIRKCNSCGKKFIKLDGCNKMVCPCGAIMCYLCRKTVMDYTHFNGMGGTEFHKCPLFTNDSMIHHEEVKTAAVRAKAEVTARNPGLELKNDPTKLLPNV